MATPEPAAKAATKAPAHRHAFTAWMTATVSATAAFYKNAVVGCPPHVFGRLEVIGHHLRTSKTRRAAFL